MTITRIAGGTVFAGPRLEPRRADITIAGGEITDITAPGPPAGPGTLDARGCFVLPGFVDCHDHLRNLMPGLAIGEGLALDAMLAVMWESQRLMGPVEYRLGALLGGVQRLRAGITTVVDHCYTYHAEGLDRATLEGLGESGIRHAYARGVMTRPYEPVVEDWEVAARRMRGIVADGLIDPDRLFVAPVSLRQASPDDYRRCVDLAAELGAGLYTHVAETAAEIGDWEAQLGTTPIHALDGLGFLGERTVLVHCVKLTDSEIEVLAERGAHVVHCPTNHMKLAKGFTRVPDLLSAGVNVALGVDMMADMLVEIRSEVGLHAVHRGDPRAVSKVQALQMATVNGGRALGWGGRVGVIAPGMAADLLVLDGRAIEHGPVLDPHYAVVYTAHSGMVRDVLVGGEAVVRDHRCTTVDEDALLAEVEDVVARYLERLGHEPPWWRRKGDPS